jgi:hypothetical protein
MSNVEVRCIMRLNCPGCYHCGTFLVGASADDNDDEFNFNIGEILRLPW